MRIIISKMLTIFLLVNIFLQTPIFAVDTIAVYNKNELVELVYDIELYNGIPYMAFDDLSLLNLEVYNKSDSYVISKGEKELVVYIESSSYTFNGETLLYDTPVKLFGSIHYISIDLIKIYFSSEYSYKNNVINLYVEPYGEGFVKGVISLPNNEVAENDMEATVFLSNLVSSTAGMPAKDPLIDVVKPTYDSLLKEYSRATNVIKKYRYVFEEKVIIKKGSNSAAFVIRGTEEDIYRSRYIGYSMDSSSYLTLYADKFNPDLAEQKVKVQSACIVEISGTVTLPTACDMDVSYAVIADGTNNYVREGIIKAGQKTSNYTIKVKYGEEYSFFVIADSELFTLKNKTQTVNVLESENSVVNLDITSPQKFDVTLTLPDDCVVPDGTVAKVYLKPVGKYYSIDEAEIIFGKNTTVSLYDTLGYEEYICYYTIEAPDGINGYGYYKTDGTTAYEECADKFNSSIKSIQIKLMKENKICVTIKLPNKELAEKDIRGRVYISPRLTSISGRSGGIDGGSGTGASSGGGVSGGTSIEADRPIIIQSGKNSGVLELTYPMDPNVESILTISSDYMDLHSEHYVAPNKTSIYREKASGISGDPLEVVLMKLSKLSGKVITDAPGLEPKLTILDKKEWGSWLRYTRAVTYDVDSGEFYAYLPSELTNAILRFEVTEDLYYADDGLTDDINLAKEIDLTSDVSNINFSYVGYNPPKAINIIAVEYDSAKGMLYIYPQNISEYTKKFSCNVALFDESGMLQGIYTVDDICVDAGSLNTVKVEIPEDKWDVSTVAKIYIWDQNLCPLSNVKHIKNTSSN